MDFLAQLEQSGIASWIRTSPSLWSYPTVLFLHTVGLGLLVGASVAIDLRILGSGREMSLAPMEKFFPVIWAGFWISALSGALLFVADAVSFSQNPVFYIKMFCIAFAMVTVRLTRGRVLRGPNADASPTPLLSKVLASASLLLWVGAITAGRLTAYIGK